MGSQQACCANWDAAAPDRQHRAFAGEQRMLGPSDAPCIATEGAKTAAVIRHMPRLPFLAKVQPAEHGSSRIQRQALYLSPDRRREPQPACAFAPSRHQKPLIPARLGSPLAIVAPHARLLRTDQRRAPHMLHYRLSPQKPPAFARVTLEIIASMLCCMWDYAFMPHPSPSSSLLPL